MLFGAPSCLVRVGMLSQFTDLIYMYTVVIGRSTETDSIVAV